MNKLNNLVNLSQEEQTIFLTDLNIDSDSLDYVVENFIDKINSHALAALIEMNGSKLNLENINKLIKTNDENILTTIANNYSIPLSVHNIRDITRVITSDLTKQHPDYKEFWYSTYVQKEDEFLNHTLNHIKNVNVLADEIIDYILEYDELKKYFNVPQGIKNVHVKAIVRNGMKLHDLAKTNSDIEFLKDNDLTEPLYKTLYKHYGKGFTPELKVIVEKLNSIDNKIIADYLEKQEEWVKALFFKVEKIADCVERGCNKVTPEEMKQDVIKPSKYLEKVLNPVELKIVKHFEALYPEYCKNIF